MNEKAAEIGGDLTTPFLLQVQDRDFAAGGGEGAAARSSAAGGDAVLAASIFHFGEYSIAEAKAHMAGRGIEVRL